MEDDRRGRNEIRHRASSSRARDGRGSTVRRSTLRGELARDPAFDLRTQEPTVPAELARRDQSAPGPVADRRDRDSKKRRGLVGGHQVRACEPDRAGTGIAFRGHTPLLAGSLPRVAAPERRRASGAWQTGVMRERATLKLDAGGELRVDVDRDDLEQADFVVRRTDTPDAVAPDLIAIAKAHLAGAQTHAAGTTERLLAADRDRAY